MIYDTESLSGFCGIYYKKYRSDEEKIFYNDAQHKIFDFFHIAWTPKYHDTMVKRLI